MPDTISAATGASDGGRLAFLPQEAPGPLAAHVPGSAFPTEAAPTLVVSFAVLTPDASGWLDVGSLPDGSPSVPAGRAVTAADTSGSDLLAPDLPGPVIVGAVGD